MCRVLLISFLVLAAAAGAACKRPETPTTPGPPPNTVIYTTVAASDGIGYGGSVVCFLFEDCPNGTGYTFVLKRRLQASGLTVTLNNRALPGAVLSQGIQTLGREIGRNDIPGNYFERIVPFIPGDTTHITIFAGGNDANVIAQAVRAGRGGTDIRAFIDGQVQQWGADLVELVRLTRARAPNATRIVALNLPNLAAAPYVFDNTTQERSILQRIAVGLSDRVNALTSQGVLVVDLMCESRLYDPGNFFSDGFHPNDRGYQLMADLAYPALANGTATTPSTSCAPRTALPVF
jgi:lysophospholipase L1-like esterase